MTNEQKIAEKGTVITDDPARDLVARDQDRAPQSEPENTGDAIVEEGFLKKLVGFAKKIAK